MKIYYRYNGFIRSSELNLIENVEEEFRETFVLLGEFGEEIYDLFGIVLVEKSWNSSGMSYNISGFNKTGNGNLGYYEGETLQVLYNIFEESWDYIQTEEEALEQLDISVERLDVEIVPNPDKLNDKDDLYTYLDPSQRIIKSCSRVKVKVPKPDIACIPVSLETTAGSTFIRDSKLTLSKNKGPRITIDTYYSGSIEGSIEYQKNLISTLYLAEDGVSYAFLPSTLVPSIPIEQEPTENFCGLNSEGLLFFNNTYYSLEEGFYDLKSINPETGPKLVRPEQIIAENTTIDFYPTPGLDKEFDTYYSLGGNDFGDPITIISCAKVVSEEVTSQEEPYIFSFKNYDSFSSEITLRLDKRTSGPYLGSWALKDNLTGDLLANSDGYVSPGINVNFSDGNFYSANITIDPQAGNSEKEYALYGSMQLVSISVNSGEEDSYLTNTAPEGILTIKSYNPNIFEYEFGANFCDLVVPNYLPENTTTMRYMFYGCKYFNQDISGWDTSRVADMYGTFSFATSFNQNINSWDTSGVTDMSKMFEGATVYNQPLNNWNTANVINLESMFNKAVAFNQNINSWDTSKVITMRGMFSGTLLFNQPLDAWNTSRVTSFSTMFSSTKVFNSPLNTWDTSSAETMSRMFYLAESFNKPLSNWNTSRVNTMFEMFYKATSFNQDLSSWDVSYFGSEPNDFALNTYNWTLPKPIWGSYGSV